MWRRGNEGSRGLVKKKKGKGEKIKDKEDKAGVPLALSNAGTWLECGIIALLAPA